MRKFKDQCQNQTVLVAMNNSTVVTYINKQGGTHSVEMCALLWRLVTSCHPYKITLRAMHIPGCLNVMVDLLSRSTKSNQQNSYCIRWCLNSSVKWFTPHVDIFSTPLNHNFPLFLSPVPDQHAWDIDALIIVRVSLPMLTLPWLSFAG